MKRRFIIILLLIFAFSTNLFGFQTKINRKGFDSIKQKDLKMHLSFLASDELQGREMCEQGSKVTAVYVATRFAHLGLIPVGDNNTYMQNFKVRRINVEPAAASFILHSEDGKQEKLNLGEDYLVVRGNIRNPLPVVFVGYGLELDNYNDYENIDVKGKIVLYFSHTPQEGKKDGKFSDPQFLKDYSLYEVNGREHRVFKRKVDIAREKGAAGIIVVENPNHKHKKNYNTLREFIFKKIYNNKFYSLNLKERKSKLRLPQVFISERTAELIFSKTGKSIYDIQKQFDKTAKPNSFEMKGIKISFTSSGEKSIKNSRNVVGLLKGSDPKLNDEIIIIGGHYDHIGFLNGKVCNGADDDASGTTGVIEIAEAFTENEIKPKRSILFIAFAGEEKGLLGSTYYADHPIFPLEKTAAMIQLDMLGRNEDVKNLPDMFKGLFGYKNPPFETADDNKNAVNIIGTTYCNEMRSINEKNNENLKLVLKFRYDDKRAFMYGSDHVPFLRKGVPSIFYFTGPHPDLHQPTDDIDKINFPKMEKICKLVYLTAWELANRDTRLKLEKPFR